LAVLVLVLVLKLSRWVTTDQSLLSCDKIKVKMTVFFAIPHSIWASKIGAHVIFKQKYAYLIYKALFEKEFIIVFFFPLSSSVRPSVVF
jgi:hypothetical protein